MVRVSRRTLRRRRLALAGGLVVCVAALSAWQFTSAAHPRHGSTGALTPVAPTRPGARGPVTAASPPTTAAPPPTTTAGGPVAVASSTISVAGSRGAFTTQVFYPASRGGPYPLIVFSPGYDIDPGAYTPLVEGWAAARYVVAVPRYRYTAPDDPGGLNESDIVHHPADLHAVIDRILGLSSGAVAPPASAASSAPAAPAAAPLAGLVDPGRIGVAGHSDGGDVTDAVVANSCCRDPRVKAAEVFSGAELTSFGGAYGSVSVPLLVVQGDADPINAPTCSQQIYSGAGTTRFYLDLHGAGHHIPYMSAPISQTPPDPQVTPGQAATYRQAVDTVSLLFWQAYLRDDASARARLAGWSVPGSADASLYTGGPFPAQGACPGAPG